MNFKLIMAILVMFSSFTFISAVMEKQGLGFASTELTASITDTDVSIPVRDTRGFLDPDYLVIDSEHIWVSTTNDTTFTVLNRGYHNTRPIAHNLTQSNGSRTQVRNNEASIMNTLAGYNIGEVMSQAGAVLGIPTGVAAYFSVFVSMLAWNYSFLDNQAGTMIKYFMLYPLSGAIVLMIILGVIFTVMGILNR